MTEEKEIKPEDKTELESNIIRQMEYYFSDINIPRDKFLRDQMQLDEGWVPLDIMLKFKLLSKLSTDAEFIAQSLLMSTSGLLEISDDNKKVRRNPEIPIPEMNEDRRKELASRTIYAKGFPEDLQLDDVLKYFRQFEEVENVTMRRYENRKSKKKLFRGSVFAIFKTKEQAEKYVESKNTKYGDAELLIMWQQEYINKKNTEKQNKEKEKERKKNKEVKIEKKVKLPRGSCFKFSEGSDQMAREDVELALKSLGAPDIAFIDFKVGDTEGWVRLSKRNAAKKLNKKIPDGKLKIDGKDVVFKLLEGDEETAYLKKTIRVIRTVRKRRKKDNRNKGRGGYKGKQNQKRKQDNDEGPPSKIKADS